MFSLLLHVSHPAFLPFLLLSLSNPDRIFPHVKTIFPFHHFSLLPFFKKEKSGPVCVCVFYLSSRMAVVFIDGYTLRTKLRSPT